METKSPGKHEKKKGFQIEAISMKVYHFMYKCTCTLVDYFPRKEAVAFQVPFMFIN